MPSEPNHPPLAAPQRPSVPPSGDPPTVHESADDSLFDLWQPQEPTPTDTAGDFGQWLLDNQLATAANLSTARSLVEKSPGKSLAEALIELGVEEADIQQGVAWASGLGFERLAAEALQNKFVDQLGQEYCRQFGVLPLRLVGSRLILGVVDPTNLLLLDEIRHRLGLAVKPVVICRKDLLAVLEASRAQPDADEQVDQLMDGMEEDEIELVQAKQDEVDLEKMAGESPVIRLVNYLISNAVKQGASDIHIEPQEKKLRIRYRIDGVLFESMTPPTAMHAAIISRLKIMGNLDIAERRLPQDGRIRAMIHGRKLDLRLSTLPTAQGEKAVMRILDNRSIQVPLDQLGMNPDSLLIWKRQIDQPHGILLVTGPTGSGKTTTLYASLGQMDTHSLNISTVEDPVEYHLGGISQVQVHDRIGMSFSAALRSLLRQDPDVIMVGEIRDGETARIAIQASLTGHLVLSTLHTNDAPSSITRLINIGVEPYLIGAAVNAVVAQRLVRKICPHCKTQVPPDDHTAQHLAMQGIAIDQVWKGKGCDRCRNTGYSGRLGIYELLVLDDFLRDRIAASPNVTEFRRLCVERGMVTLRQDGFEKIAQGITTVDEVLRVTESSI